MNLVDTIISSYLNNKSLYLGEQVTISEHMIQTAMLAENNGSPSNLVCSSLLHDYGHFILDRPDNLVKEKKDGKHEDVGYDFLKKYFNKKVLDKFNNLTGAHKADLWRYCILFLNGGIYLDIKTVLRKPLSEIFTREDTWYTVASKNQNTCYKQ